MSLLTLAALVVLAPPQVTLPAVSAVVQETVQVAPTAAVDAPAQIRELRAAVSSALKGTVVGPAFDSEAAVPRLATVYAALRQDRHLAVTERDRLLARVKSRLRQIEQHLVREARRNPGTPATAAKRPAKINVPAAQAVLAQQAGAGFPGMPGFPNGAGAGGAGMGGAGQGMGSGSQAGGLSLVELIQTTIAPETWDVNGGKGTIRFFGPLDVLVVSQTW